MQGTEKEVESPPKKRPKLSTKRKVAKVVERPVAAASAPPSIPALARAASPPPARLRSRSPSPVTRGYQDQLRARRGMEPMSEDLVWDFDDESVGGVRAPPTPPTPPTTRPVRKSKNRAMESISVMQLEEEEGEYGHVGRRYERRDEPSERLKKRPVLRSIDEIDLEKARVELTLRQLELQMARDKALVTRAKARAQLLEQGVPRREVDRLMPLDI
ncbi:unnamed protein product [Phytophthora lilii]|uniref:Unnamed protein product n=1 Tax=Phytophthora lilii TaxID=2077276 RepID=A0A9W6TWL5_9STRA|nr:unnamed protein product [Phytophthora lilii]